MLLRSLIVVLLLTRAVAGQTAPSPEQLIEAVTPSVATVLTGSGTGALTGVGTAVVVRENGVLLTAYHVVKDAREVQVKLRNGEIYDHVKLLGVDERRDIAALQIPATHLPTLQFVSIEGIKAGATVFAVCQSAALPWSASSGMVSAVRLAEEVPGAGSGYRLVQFTAPVAAGASGGLLVDGAGHLIGIIVGSMLPGQNLNFAVPVENVLGLADSAPTLSYQAGAQLRLPTAAPTPPPKLVEGMDVTGPEKSDALSSRDPQVIMKKFRTIYVQSNSVWVKDEVVKDALRNRPEFNELGMVIVDDAKVADAILTTDRVLFTWDFTYRLVHQNTSIILASGRFTRIDGITAANTFAEDILKKVKAARMPPGEEKRSDQKRK